MTQSYKILDKVDSPKELKKLPLSELPLLAEDMRQFLIGCVSETGGHLGAGLGTVDFTIALHYVFNSPKDKFIWDVSHQAYPHKILTGRKDRMSTLRQEGGLSGFTDPRESEHDHFHVAHAGTAISQALGMATARDSQGLNDKIIAIVGDGAMTSGLAFEGLNNAGHSKTGMMIVLNDNKMSIAKNVGALSHYLTKIISNPLYNRVRDEVEKSIENFPRIKRLTAHALESMKHMVAPGILFEELGFRYFGPVDGHDVEELVKTFERLKNINEPILLHMITEKGKGYKFAEQDHERFHGVTPFNVNTGEKVSGKSESGKETLGISYTQGFANAVTRLAEEDSRVVVISAAMPTGTGLAKFQKKFPERFFDVGIAEQHAVTFAGALAKSGVKPICAIYSTFLQRAQDQLIHDISLQHVGLTVCMDRAGLVGADGATHNGVFDIGYLSHIPGVVIAAPVSESEMYRMLQLSVNYKGLFAIRYPRDNFSLALSSFDDEFEIGEGKIVEEGEDIVLLSFGALLPEALKAATILKTKGLHATIVHQRFAIPLDRELLLNLLPSQKYLFTLEEHVLTGGFGSRVLEFLDQESIHHLITKRFALPNEHIDHGRRENLLERCGLSGAGIAGQILQCVNKETSPRLLGTSLS